MIYLLTFAISVLFLYIAGKCRGLLAYFFVTVGLLIPCILASTRDSSIGTDVGVYGIWTFQTASQNDLISFLELSSSTSPPGFNLFSWVIINASNSFEIYLGSLQFLTIVPVYITAHYLFNKHEWLCMLCYFFLIYPLSLNVMKQCIAVAIGFVAIIFAFKKQPLHYLIIILLAISFHQTGFIAALTYPILRLTLNPNSGRKLLGKWRNYILIMLGVTSIAIIFLFGEKIIYFFAQFKESYTYQIMHIGDGSTNEATLVLAVAAFAIWWICRQSIDNVSNNIKNISVQDDTPKTAIYDFYFVTYILGCTLIQLELLSESVGRVGYYFIPYAGLFVSSLTYCTDKKSSYASFVLVVLFTFYFIFAFIFQRGGEIYPFVTTLGEIFY